MIQNGHEISFTRRRYGKATFTWIYVKFGDRWQETGDPLQKIMPSKKDVEDAVSRAHAHRAVTNRSSGETK